MWNIGWMKEHCNCSQSLMYIYIHNIQTFDRAWQTFGEVRAPPVATLLLHLISSHHFLGTACGDTVFWCSGTASGYPSHFISPHYFDFCGHRLWRLSFLFFHTVSCLFGHHQWQLFYICHLSSKCWIKLLQFGATHIKFRISSVKRRMRKKSSHKHIFIFQHCWRVSLFLGWATPSYCWALHTYTHTYVHMYIHT